MYFSIFFKYDPGFVFALWKSCGPEALLAFLLSICAALMNMNKQAITQFGIDLLLTYYEAILIQ